MIDLASCSNQPVNCWIKISLSSPSWSPSNKKPHVLLYAPRFTGANVEPKLENVSLEKLRIFGPPCPPPQPKKIVPLAKTCTQAKKRTSSSVNPKNVHRGFSKNPPLFCATPKLQWPWVYLYFRALAPKQDSWGGMVPTSPLKYWLFNDGMLIFHISPIWLGRISSRQKSPKQPGARPFFLNWIWSFNSQHTKCPKRPCIIQVQIHPSIGGSFRTLVMTGRGVFRKYSPSTWIEVHQTAPCLPKVRWTRLRKCWT